MTSFEDDPFSQNTFQSSDKRAVQAIVRKSAEWNRSVKKALCPTQYLRKNRQTLPCGVTFLCTLSSLGQQSIFEKNVVGFA